MNTLISSEIRIEWAKSKLDQLEALVQREIDDALKVPITESSDDRMKVLLDLLGKVTPEARRLVSEYALHARAALDYIVYDLALHNTGAEQKGTQFPICKCAENFPKRTDGTGTGPLKHLTTEQVALVERFQPYKGFPLIQVLHGLSNQDKHRQFAHIEATSMTAMVHKPNTDPVTGNAKTDVKFHRSFEISLGEQGDAAKTLRQVHAHLSAILTQFNSLLTE
jgi:hypothetical protein